MKKVGRPKKEIDYRVVRECSELFCSMEDIGNILGISRETLRKDEQFLCVYKEGRENAKKELHRCQWQSATRGNVTMQIWLGKNYLYQREPKFEIEESVIDLKEAAELFLNNVESR